MSTSVVCLLCELVVVRSRHMPNHFILCLSIGIWCCVANLTISLRVANVSGGAFHASHLIFFAAISGHAKKKIAHQANPPSVAENPFASLFSDLVLPRLFGGPERQTSHFVSGYRVLYPFSE